MALEFIPHLVIWAGVGNVNRIHMFRQKTYSTKKYFSKYSFVVTILLNLYFSSGDGGSINIFYFVPKVSFFLLNQKIKNN